MCGYTRALKFCGDHLSSFYECIQISANTSKAEHHANFKSTRILIHQYCLRFIMLLYTHTMNNM